MREKVNSKDIDPEDYFRYRPLSANELYATVKNKILDNKCERDIQKFRDENKTACFKIINNKRQIEKTITNIKDSTGYAFGKRAASAVTFSSNGHTLSGFFDDESHSRSKTSMSSSSSQSSYGSRSSTPHQVKSKVTFVSDDNSSMKNKQPKKIEDSLFISLKRSQSLYQLSANIAKKSADVSRKKSHSALTNKNPKDLVHWKKLQNKKAMQSKRDKEIKEFIFEDKTYLRKYLKFCEERDAVPKVPPETIQYLKEHDKVFAKRHRQFYSAKMCNRAPKFDINDLYVPVVMPPIVMRKKKEEIEAIVHQKSDTNTLTKMFQGECDRISDMVKKFVKEFSEI